MATITAAQLRTIQAKVNGLMEEQHSLAERRLLHARSREMTSMWPDALQARRQKKKKDREEKLAKEEAIRAELDQQDTAEQEVNRSRMLQEAAKKLWQQTDERKTVQRLQLLADVAHQRQNQLAEQAQRAVAERASESAFLAKQELRRQEALKQEETLAHAANKMVVELSRANEEQLDVFKARLLGEREAARRDGRKVQEQALQDAQQEALKAKEKRESASKALRETEQANRMLLELKQQQREQEQLDDAQIAAYKMKKAAQDEERAAVVAAKNAAREAHRRSISQRMEESLLEKRKAADARHTVAAVEARLREDTSATEGAMRRAARSAEVERMRREQVAQKQEQAELFARECQASREHISSALQAFKAEEEEKAARCRAQSAAHAAFLRHQIEANHLRRAQSSC